MTSFTVSAGERSYPVELGPLSGLGAAMARRLEPGPCALVSNERVAPLYAAAAAESLGAAGFSPRLHLVPDGEAHKTLDTWRALVESLLASGVSRDTPVVALGGGVTGDIAGFAAATTLRGLPLVQVPTTLLAMVDSAVGGKTGVNTPAGKNLVGAFHQPVLVRAPLETLRTLDPAELRCGLGEVVKHALLADPDLMGWLEAEAPALLACDPDAIGHVVRRSVEIKAAVVSQDEREAGLRATLNLGHTAGHAIEHALGFGALRHGEAVALGLLAEAWLGVARGISDVSLPARIRAVLRALGLPAICPPLSEQALLRGLGMDKKRTHGRLRAVIPLRVGEVRVMDVEPHEVVASCHRAAEGQEDR